MEEMKQGVYRDTLKDIYIDESVIAHQEERYVKAMAEYQKLYGDREVEVYSAPGRCEVGGNHTDHQHGMVLATSINLDAIAIVNKNVDMTVRVVSVGYDMIVIDANDVEKVDKEEGCDKTPRDKSKATGLCCNRFGKYKTEPKKDFAGSCSQTSQDDFMFHCLTP